MADEADVVVVGAGLAGLRCARALRAAGRHVVVLEASDGPGVGCAPTSWTATAATAASSC